MYLKVSRIAELHTMCPNLHTTTTFTPLTPSWHFPQWLFSAVNRRPQLTFEITIAIAITMRASRAFLSLAALCGASINGFSVFLTCLPHEILFISCVLSSLFRPHQVQIAVQAWMDEEDRVKSYTTKMEMEICKDETKWNEMKCICIWKTYERAEEEEAEKLTQKRKTKLESQRENLWEPKLKSRKNATASSVALISGWKWKNLTQGCWTCHRGSEREKGGKERASRQRET